MNCQAITPCGPPNWIALPWVPFLALLLAAGAHPAHGAGVVGSGTPESCTEAALDAALAGGGLVTFDCGAELVTSTVTAEKIIAAGAAPTTVDGVGLITLSGGNAVRVFNVDPGAMLDLRNLTVASGYDSAAGGGIGNGGSLTVTSCTLAHNNAGSFGGGMVSSGNLTVTNSTFTDNSAGAGGGIFNTGSLTMIDSTFAGNNAGATGGAIHNGGCLIACASGALSVINSTIAGNSAPDGGGIYHDRGTLLISNTILANNMDGGDCIYHPDTGTVTDGGHNLIGDAASSCGLVNGENGNLVGVDPLLDPEGLKDSGDPTQTIALLPDSPAIDAGDPAVCANPPVNGLDQRGYVRPGVGHTVCSIGAYEADAIPVAACVGDCDGDAMVAVDELILGVDIALGEQPVGACPAFRNSDGMVDIAQLITGVDNALDGCAAG